MDWGETFEVGGKRECIEEAGMQVQLKGVLNVDYYTTLREGHKTMLRMIYYAEPVSLEAADNPKS